MFILKVSIRFSILILILAALLIL